MGNSNTGKVTIWNKTFVCCVLTNVFFCFAHFITTPLMSTYAGYLGASASFAGVLAGLYCAIAFAMRPVSGPAITYGNKKYLMIGTFALGVLVNILYGFFPTIPMFVITRVIHGIQYSFFGSLCLTVASASLPKEKLGSGIGVFGVAGIFGSALGPSLGIYLENLGATLWGEGGGYKMAFLGATVFCIASLIPCFFVDKQRSMTKEERKELGPWYANIIAVPAIAPSVMIMLYNITFILFSTYLVPYAAQYGIAGVSTFFMINAAATLAVRPFAGHVLDKYGHKVMFAPCTALFLIGVILVGTANSLAPVLVSGAVIGIGWGSLQPAMQAIAMASVPVEKGGAASNTTFFGIDLGYFIGPSLGGAVYAMTGSYHAMFLLGVIPILVGFAIFFVLWLRERKQKANG